MITTYPSKVTHTSFFTDEDGDLILPEALKLGNYRIEEIAAPFGYVVNETYVKVAVDTDTAYEIDPETYEAIITVDYEDAPVVGELTVEKKGEVLDSYKGGLSLIQMKSHSCTVREALQVPSMKSMQLRISLQLICRKTLMATEQSIILRASLWQHLLPEMMESSY